MCVCVHCSATKYEIMIFKLFSLCDAATSAPPHIWLECAHLWFVCLPKLPNTRAFVGKLRCGSASVLAKSWRLHLAASLKWSVQKTWNILKTSAVIHVFVIHIRVVCSVHSPFTIWKPTFDGYITFMIFWCLLRKPMQQNISIDDVNWERTLSHIVSLSG